MSATPLVFFFHFGVCVVYVCGIYTCAHACMGAHVHAESRRGYQVPDLLLSTLFPQEPCPVSS